MFNINIPKTPEQLSYEKWVEILIDRLSRLNTEQRESIIIKALAQIEKTENKEV